MIPNVDDSGQSRLHFICPSKGLLGFRFMLTISSHGSALMHRSFLYYEPSHGPIVVVRKGVLVPMAASTIILFALMALEASGTRGIGGT